MLLRTESKMMMRSYKRKTRKKEARTPDVQRKCSTVGVEEDVFAATTCNRTCH